jgi:hypothetical protein
MGFALLARLALLYLFSSKPGLFTCLSSSPLSASSSRDADEHEPRRQLPAGFVAVTATSQPRIEVRHGCGKA